MTIIITTHYIEEARKADAVCLLREGKVLVEDAPDVIMRRYELDSLEEAFLKICQDADEKKKPLIKRRKHHVMPLPETFPTNHYSESWEGYFNTIGTLVKKTFKIRTRNLL